MRAVPSPAPPGWLLGPRFCAEMVRKERKKEVKADAALSAQIRLMAANGIVSHPPLTTPYGSLIPTPLTPSRAQTSASCFENGLVRRIEGPLFCSFPHASRQG